MQLSEHQLKQYKTAGFISFQHFFSPRETRALRLELKRIYDAELGAGNGINCAVQTDGTKRENYGEKQNLQVIPLSNRSDYYRSLPFHPKVLSVVKQLIGDSFILKLDQVFWKPAKNGIGTSWHQDNAYFKISDPMRGKAMWIAIHNANLDNGCLHVIPGSHRQSYDHYRDEHSDRHIHCNPQEEHAVPIQLPAGGVVFFSYGVVHCTTANHSNKGRAAVALHFLHNDYGGFECWKKDNTRFRVLLGPRTIGAKSKFDQKFPDQWYELTNRILS